jgi:hypothetical protein
MIIVSLIAKERKRAQWLAAHSVDALHIQAANFP